MISVIIPVYQVERYIEKCMESVINQTYSDIEIIIVNDGSLDHSIDICENFRKQDSRIQIVHKKNGGLMSAWMEGLKRASGEWIFFVDSDDWVEKNAIDLLYNSIADENIDIVCGNYYIESDNGSIPDKHSIKSGVYVGDKIKSEIIPKLISNSGFMDRGIRICRWAKLIRRELLLKNVHYCDCRLTIGEDMNIMVPTIVSARGIQILENAYIYHYRMNPDSIMKKMSPTMWKKVELLFEKMSGVCAELDHKILRKQLEIDFLDMTIMVIEKELRHLSIKHINLDAVLNSKYYEFISSEINPQRYKGTKRKIACLLENYQKSEYIKIKLICILKQLLAILKTSLKNHRIILSSKNKRI